MISEHSLPTRRATRELAVQLAKDLTPGSLVLLHGELGAGKTFLARAILRALGVPENTPVPSPTFTLVQEYQTERGLIVHADLYRLREGNPEKDLPQLGLVEHRREGAILIVEWGDGLEAFLGPSTHTVMLKTMQGPNGRSAKVMR